MNGKTYAYLDLAALLPVGDALLDPRPAFAFRGDGSAVLWANAAGLDLLAEPSMGALLERRFPSGSPLREQAARLAKQVPADRPQVDILRFNFGVSQLAIPALCRRLNLPRGASALLAIAAGAAPKESLATRAERLADAIAGEDCLVAVLDGDGRVLGASGGFEVLAPAAAAIDALIGEAGSGGGRVVKRALPVGATLRPAGIARVGTGEAEFFLLIVGPEDIVLPAGAGAGPPTSAPAMVPLPAAPLTRPPLGTAADSPDAPDIAGPLIQSEVPAPAPTPATIRAAATVRFLWETDASSRIAFVSNELASAMGAENAAILGLTWQEAADRFGLDPEGLLARAMADHAGFAGLTVYWPVAGGAERVAVELQGLAPVRSAAAAGYRGFGLIRLDDRRIDDRPARHAITPPMDLPTAAGPSETPPSAAAPAPAAEQPAIVEAPRRSGEPLAFPEEDIDDAARKSIEEGRSSRQREPTGPAPASAPGRTASMEPRASNVVRLPGTPTRVLPRRLSGTEQDAFRRIAEALGSRHTGEDDRRTDTPAAGEDTADPDRRLVDLLPIGIVVYRNHRTFYANRTLLDLLGFETFETFSAAGGVEAMFPHADAIQATPQAGLLTARRRDGSEVAVEARLHAVQWAGATALMLSLVERAAPATAAPRAAPAASDVPLATAGTSRIDELNAILDTATDGVIVIDAAGRIDSLNRSAEALFGIAANTVTGKPFTDLFAEESRRAALDYLDGLASNGVASVLNDGREVIGKVPKGGLIPLFMTMGRLGDSGKYCAVLRDITHWKNVEDELVAARRAAEAANAQKSDFLAKISHEIRTPLNAIIGFSEVMMEERFGPVGNDRYRTYLRDIHLSGTHLMSLINDLLDLSKIEAGKLDLSFEAVGVNEVIQECVALMQPQANRERIIIRTSLAANVPQVVADLRSLRQILLNLLSNAIKFTRPGGQVIVATALEEGGEVVVRVRDTGIGMTEKDLETAMKPFRQVAGSGRGAEGTGLGLPLTKALVEANRAAFAIESVPNQGTLVKVTFPTTRVLAG